MTPSPSIRALLVGDVDRAESTSTLRGRVSPDLLDDVLTGVSSALRSAAEGEVARAIDGLTGMDVFDLISSGWRKHRLLTEAGRRTLASPGSRELVELASHRITAGYRPRIDVYLDEAKVGEIEITLQVTADIAAVIGLVVNGRLIALQSGHIDLTATLDCGGIEIAKGETRIELTAEMSLGEGISLVDEPTASAHPQPGGHGGEDEF